jgi:uncharacterized protein (TIGR02266 family)
MPDRHFRAQPRPELRVRIRWRRLDEPHTREVDAQSKNVGVGGAFIITETPPPIGTLVEIAIASPATWEPVRVRGQVRWLSAGGPDEDPGMGIAFQDLAPRDVVALHDFFVSLQFSADS